MRPSMPRPFRLALIVLIAIGLAPGARDTGTGRVRNFDDPVHFTALALPGKSAGEAQLIGGWRLSSTNDHFGGYSAMAAVDARHLVAASDRGRILHLGLPDIGPPTGKMGYLGGAIQPVKGLTDIESLAHDPRSGRFWIGYEGHNAIDRLDRKFHSPERARPAQMEGWPKNRGPEAIARLADGRFLVLAEGNGRWPSESWDFPGLLFSGDPVDGAPALSFRFAAPKEYRPVDMVPIPDGRVLILLRKLHWALPPRFTSVLMVADPAQIAPGGQWVGRQIAAIEPPLPSDNYEGLAMWPRGDGSLDLWIISDDNQARFQRTLLLQLRWDPAQPATQAKQKARSPAARPSA